MPIYSAAVRTAAPATNVAYAALRASATRPVRVREIHCFVAAATSSGFGLVRSTAVGTASTSVLGQAEDPDSPAALTNLDSAWSGAPTAGTVFMRRYLTPATIGAGIMWAWPPGRELVIPVSGSILIVNIAAATGGVADAAFVWEE